MSMHNPAHPREILRELVIEPLGLTVTDVSEHLNSSRSLAAITKCLRSLGMATEARLTPFPTLRSIVLPFRPDHLPVPRLFYPRQFYGAHTAVLRQST